jgi:hypothetical protein
MFFYGWLVGWLVGRWIDEYQAKHQRHLLPVADSRSKILKRDVV